MKQTGQVLDNLPLPLNRFIGRTAEINALKQRVWLTRLLTLTGPGGCGKTRLALKVAEELHDVFGDGVWLVELAPLSDPALVPQTVATTFGVQERTARPPLSVLIDFLRPRELLLVLDNCEHLIDACAQLTHAVLQACPEVRILATSREALNVAGESAWLVPSLSIEHPRQTRTLSDLRRSEAAQLFLDRAATAQAAFAPTDDQSPAIAQICYRLDGMPLAIELAAARVRTLAIEQIAARLDDRFNLLNAGSRTAPARHQTLRAMIDWSYGLLSPVEKTLFRRLAVFAGGWTLEAAESVCATVDGEAGKLLDILGRLVDKSLVICDPPHHEARYRFLETIRQYAAEKLSEAGEKDGVRDRHLDYFSQWAQQAAPHLDGPEQIAWLDRFEAEHDNVRAALEWSRAAVRGAEAGLRLAGAAGLFWRKRGYHSEGRQHLADALARAEASSVWRGQALIHAAMLAYLQSDYPASRSLGEAALAFWQRQGPTGKRGVAEALDVLGETATEEGDCVTAEAQFEQALAIWREVNHAFGIGDMLVQLGWAAMRTGDYEQAGARLEESLGLFRSIGDTGMEALILSGLGELAVRQAQYERATQLLEESLALRQEQGHKWGIGTCLGTLGWVALLQREFKRMRFLLGESLSLRMEIGHQGGIAWCLEKLAEAAHLQGRSETAARIFGAAAALRAPIGSVIDPVDQVDYDRLIASLRSTLGDSAFDAYWAQGQALTLDKVFNEALAAPDEPLKPAAHLDKEKYRGLTAREREVAVLIAKGNSNRDIAKVLVIELKTVEAHVTRILNKLGFDNRVQIATWAVNKGLALPSDS